MKKIADQFFDQTVKPFQNLLGLLNALHVHYWTSHWQASGNTSYSDHLLFERIYLSIRDEIDTLAEKMVATFGVESVNLLPILEAQHKYAERLSGAAFPLMSSNSFDKSLLGEKMLSVALQAIVEGINISLGMDDFLASTASNHETNVFLLRQRLGGK